MARGLRRLFDHLAFWRKPAVRAGLGGLVLLMAAPALAQDSFQTTVRNAILLDLGTESVLFEKAADEPQAPASLAKLMTLAVIFEEMRQGRLQAEGGQEGAQQRTQQQHHLRAQQAALAGRGGAAGPRALQQPQQQRGADADPGLDLEDAAVHAAGIGTRQHGKAGRRGHGTDAQQQSQPGRGQQAAQPLESGRHRLQT